jgi:HEAT repeat protein
MRAKDAVDGLIALTKDADPSVRNSAAHSLGEI